MSNPVPAFKGSSCNNCGEQIDENDDLYLHDGEKFCTDCANKNNLVCDCGNYKKEEYETCYDCKE